MADPSQDMKRERRKNPASSSTPKERRRLTKEMGDIQLFKYRSINKYLLDSLAKGQLHFASPPDLNDPYDCQVDLTRAIRRAAAIAKGKQISKLRHLLTDSTLLKTVQDLTLKTAVCSFSNSLLNPVLWSHYADEHRGISILYELPQDFITNPKTGIVGYSGVEYAENALTDWLVRNPIQFDADYYVEIVKRLLTIKGPGWAYEDEARIMRDAAGQLNIDRKFLRQICFGLRTSETDKDRISKIVNAGYSKVHFCEIFVGDSDFGLAVRDV